MVKTQPLITDWTKYDIQNEKAVQTEFVPWKITSENDKYNSTR